METNLVRLVQERLLAEQAGEPGENGGPRRDQVWAYAYQVLSEAGVAPEQLRAFTDEVVDEVAGFGPLETLLRDRHVTEIMVNGCDQVVVEWRGRLVPTGIRFRSNEHLLEVISRMVAPLGRRLDHSSPYVDARLPDGSRIHALLPPLSLQGPLLTIRKFSRRRFRLGELVAAGTLSTAMADFLHLCLRARLNIVVSGATSSGKTTTLNCMLGLVGNAERVITVEDSAELTPAGGLSVSLEARPANSEGQGEVTLRHLLRNALRMRPDRLVVGEVRGAEAFDLLLAMNTGHPALTTVHANHAADALARLETMALMAGEGLPLAAVREQLRRSVDVVVHQQRDPEGRRRVTEIAAVDRSRYDRLALVPLFGAGDSPAPAPPCLLRRLADGGYQPFSWLRGA